MTKSKLNKRKILATCAALLLSGAAVIGASVNVSATESPQQGYSTTQSESRTIPSGAYAVNLNVNGRKVLQGKVFYKNNVTYVPMKGFADWQGMFTYSYDRSTSTATIKGTNLEINARAGKYYIEANGRYFYTVGQVLYHEGEIYVPIQPMTKALNSKLVWSGNENTYYVYSGDSRRLGTGAQTYRQDEVYWLARIISAEAKGEPIQGKLAVGNVVLNRVRSSAYPNTIYGVIFDRKFGVQFSPVSNGTIYQTPTADSIIAAKMCLEGYTVSRDVIYFLNPSIATSSWITRNRPYAFTIGKHAFYE